MSSTIVARQKSENWVVKSKRRGDRKLESSVDVENGLDVAYKVFLKDQWNSVEMDNESAVKRPRGGSVETGAECHNTFLVSDYVSHMIKDMLFLLQTPDRLVKIFSRKTR